MSDSIRLVGDDVLDTITAGRLQGPPPIQGDNPNRRPFTSDDLVRHFATGPANRGYYRGIRLHLPHPNQGEPVALSEQRRLIEAMESEASQRSTGPSSRYANPIGGRTAPMPGRDGGPYQLSPGDLELLRQIADDPAKVSAGDAAHLARLGASVQQGSSDHLLVERKLGLVRNHHAAAALRHQLAQLGEAPPQFGAKVTNQGIAAVAAAMRAELAGQFTDQELAARARDKVNEALAKAHQQHQGRRDELTTKLAELETPAE
jgi:hypothetical protein